MHRYKLVKMLEEYSSSCEQQNVKEEILKFVKEYKDCFKRTLAIGHVTASAWLLNKEQTHALLMHHAKLKQWVQLGGHCDGNADVLQVAVKEAQEESGINAIVPVHESIFDIDIHLIAENSKEKAHYHYDIRFLLKVTSDEKVIKNNESNELRWIEKNRSEMPTQSDSVIRMFDKWVSLNL